MKLLLIGHHLLRRQRDEVVLAQPTHKERPEHPAVATRHTAVKLIGLQHPLVVAHNGHLVLKRIDSLDQSAHGLLHLLQPIQFLFVGLHARLYH